MLAFLWVDGMTPHGVADWVGYLITIQLAYRLLYRQEIVALTVLSFFFILLGYFISPSGPVGSDISIANRVIAELALLASTYVLLKRKKAEEARLESETKYRTLFELGADAVLPVAYPGGQILDANPAALALYGYDREELLQMRALDLSAEPEQTEAALVQVAFQGTHFFPYRHHRKKDGTVFPVEIHAVSFVLAGRPTLLSTIRDISQRRAAEQEKEKLQEQLHQAQKMESVGRLAGGIAHDFNNMLGVILGHTELVQNQLGTFHPAYHHLMEIYNAAERSADLTRQLLAFARKQVVSPRVLDLNETVEGMLKMLQRLIGENIDLVWIPGKDLGPILMDSTQIHQILTNLCINARDAIQGAGAITIRTGIQPVEESRVAEQELCHPGDYVTLMVSDNGCGMERAIQEKLFEPFFTTKEIGKGSGLGLATIYGIVKQNQGSITFCSEPGQGTTFTIYLPQFKGENRPGPKNGSPAGPPGGRDTILVVEDDVALMKMSTAMLEKMGYQVLAVSTPEEAIRIVQDQGDQIHLLLTDLIMPRMNGHQLSRRLRALSPSLKVLFMSGYTRDTITSQGILEEGIHFIEKPFRAADLAVKVREVLDQQQRNGS